MKYLFHHIVYLGYRDLFVAPNLKTDFKLFEKVHLFMMRRLGRLPQLIHLKKNMILIINSGWQWILRCEYFKHVIYSKKIWKPKEILYIFNVYYPLNKIYNINIELVIKYIWIIIFSKENKMISILSSHKITLCIANMWITIGYDKDR